LVLFVPISRHLLVMVVKLGVVLATLLVSTLFAILVIRTFSVLCQSQAAGKGNHQSHAGTYPQTYPHKFPPMSFPRNNAAAAPRVTDFQTCHQATGRLRSFNLQD
jgi:hypothetical protein